MSNGADSNKSGWGHQVGQALAVLIPALLTAAAGYWAGGSGKPNPVPTVSPDPAPSLDDGTTRQSLDDAHQLALTKTKLEEAQAKIETLPSELLTSADDFKTASDISLPACIEKLTQEINKRNLRYETYGDRLFQVSNANIGQYILCQKDGNISYFAIGSEDVGTRTDWMKTIVKSAFES